jgi:hypothetical protein
MNSFKQIITNIFTRAIPPNFTHKPLGRWNIETCSKIINHKIDLSNEDHCGPCGQYAIEKIKREPVIAHNPFKP